MYNSLVSVMREVVEDLETNYEVHPRAHEWRARLMERLLEYGDREDTNNNDQSEVNNNSIPQHPQQGKTKTKVKLKQLNCIFSHFPVAGPPPPPPPPMAPAPPKPKLLRFPGAEGK